VHPPQRLDIHSVLLDRGRVSTAAKAAAEAVDAAFHDAKRETFRRSATC
jgi:hypothetical protein